MVLRKGGKSLEKCQLPCWVTPLPGHAQKQLLVTILSHPQTKCPLQFHKSPTCSQEDTFRRYGWEGDLLTLNLEGRAEGGDRETERQIKRQGEPLADSHVHAGRHDTIHSNPNDLFLS